MLETLSLQGVEVMGAIIAEADNRFLRLYYGRPLKKRGPVPDPEEFMDSSESTEDLT